MTGESRKALIIANSRYNDSKLARLSAPDVDARALEEVLRDTKVGFFDTVTVLRDKTHSEVRQEIFRLFHHAKRDDTLLLYFTGHGVLDNDGRLYLAVSDTKTDELLISGIPANFISDTMDRSRSRRQLLVLDCCHSGAFARGSRNSLERSVGTKSAFEGENGRGRFIMTATDELQYAWEGDDLIRGDGQSRFSYHFVEGLRSGKADREQNGYITVDDLYDYVFEQVKADSPQNKPQTPRLETYRKEGSLLVAKNLHTYPKEKQPPPRRVGGLVTLGDLRTVLDDVFEAEQIENMAFDLRLDERSLGQTKSAKIRSLLRQLDQQNRLTELLNWLHRNTPELFAEVFGKRDAVEMEAKAEPPAQPRSEPQMLVTTPEHLRSKTTGTKAETTSQLPPTPTTVKQETSLPAQPIPTPIWRRIPMLGWGIAAVLFIVIAISINSILGGGATPTVTPTEVVVTRIPTQASGPTPLTAPPSVYGIEWVEIPEGPFMMGAAQGDSDADSDESPLHEVTVDTFWIAKTEVTNEQYKAFVDATGHRVPFMTREDYDFYTDEQYNDWIAPYVDEFNWDTETRTYPEGKGNHPVVQVSWEDAVAYTEWLSEETGLAITLPSEAEWEKVARGDGDTRIYSWGDEFDGNLSNYCDSNCEFDWRDTGSDDGFLLTAPVGSYPNGASPYGVLDMSGNVWEWMRSIYDQESYPYPYDPADGREEMDASALRVLRGGSWTDNSGNARVSYRLRFSAVDRSSNDGFRVVVVRPPSQQ